MTRMDPGPVTPGMVRASAQMTVTSHLKGRALLCNGCRQDPDNCGQLSWAVDQLATLAAGGDVLVVP